MADLKEHIITRLLLFGSLTVIEAVLFNKEENVGWPFEYKEVGLLVGQAKFWLTDCSDFWETCKAGQNKAAWAVIL